MTDDTTETEDETQTELDEPIKIRWTGYARERIYGYNLDFEHESSDRVVDALDRQKTNAVIETVEEAEALAGDLTGYKDGAGDEGRIWVNGAISAALNRVYDAILDGMHDRGYVVENPGSMGISFVPATDDVSRGDSAAVAFMKRVRGRIESEGEATIDTLIGLRTLDDTGDIRVEHGNVHIKPGFAGSVERMSLVDREEARE